MPISTSTIYSVTSYKSPAQFPPYVWDAFNLRERDANIMLPHALKCLDKEQLYGQYWIVCTTQPLHGSHSVDFILSCTTGPLGDYPIFIFSAVPFSQLAESYMIPRIEEMASRLHQLVPNERVFSIFAPKPITVAFAKRWCKFTGVQFASQPEYYAATFSHCTRRTFVKRRMTYVQGMSYKIRPAVEEDQAAIARLCRDFAATSEPFILSHEAAWREAGMLIHNGKIWVHEISEGGCATDIASIAAFTRESDRVAAITKVYTNPLWRQRGCAERLVRAVTEHLLRTKESVVLYVSHGNPAAKVYDRVGFVGLRGNAEQYEGVDPWLELGFDPKVTRLGHW
ncbi:hypothetical protein GLOTRDRAFT_52422 [Gloeophyllum trabeum ATCC 11539]|uniref:N-acetyltransferase domain-containing protein n=1 Tax=Gloeophyllum trabeum (strain ATCC 11539 / FP-39264 / Madison 617) TaxID=670483 RepID=S7QLP8_GLOTA|nr:uncharacterized protein GLOTRDRAFT_52422 [Gloeophyllum trabeum ATCC 11539]EPQ60347.1 hypothetical protein GLOTRDRAFT_52422 [Gloeophyllum trabeum ATCC 11539]